MDELLDTIVHVDYWYHAFTEILNWIGHLGVVYTMDHEVVPRPYKFYDWMLNSSQDHFNLHQRKKKC